MAKDLGKIYDAFCTTAVFCETVEKPLFRYFERYMESETRAEKMRAYGKFVAEIYALGGSLTDAVCRLLSEDENVFVKTAAREEPVKACIAQATKAELTAFSAFASLTLADFEADLKESGLPAFKSKPIDLVAYYSERLKNIERHGYGIFATNGMFRFSDDKQIVPIRAADKIPMSHFVGYERERQAVVDNTLSFLQGNPAANVLLYGDAGAGKSSTVKAIANKYFDQGLRLIEIRKNQLCHLPLVMEKIAQNPLKFILFIDDLSFQQSDDDFSMLKAALEGSASARAENCLLYATSNRRHIVRETFADREGGDVHRNDTLQETLLLSERFGLTVYFSKPDKKLYLEIVEGLAKRKGIAFDADVATRAEAFALKRGNRSARCAEQFVDSLL